MRKFVSSNTMPKLLHGLTFNIKEDFACRPTEFQLF